MPRKARPPPKPKLEKDKDPCADVALRVEEEQVP